MMAAKTLAAAAAVALAWALVGCGVIASPQPDQPTTAAASLASASGPVTAGVTDSPPAASPAATESNPPGDIPDNQAYVAFTPAGGGLSVKIPEGWARATLPASTVFTDKLNRIEIAVSKVGSAPTVSSVKRTDLVRLSSSVPRFALGSVTAVHRASQPVVLVLYRGDSAPDPVTGKVVRDSFERYSYYRNGLRLDLTLAGPTNADNVDPWRIVSDSVRWQ